MKTQPEEQSRLKFLFSGTWKRKAQAQAGWREGVGGGWKSEREEMVEALVRGVSRERQQLAAVGNSGRRDEWEWEGRCRLLVVDVWWLLARASNLRRAEVPVKVKG